MKSFKVSLVFMVIAFSVSADTCSGIKGLIHRDMTDIKYYLTPDHYLYQQITGIDPTRGERCFTSEAEAQNAGFFALPIRGQSVSAPVQSTGLGISYSEAVAYIDDTVIIKEVEPLDGNRQFVGEYENAWVRMLGDPQNLQQITLIVFANPGTAGNIGASALTVRLLMNVFPQWEGVSDWVSEAITRQEPTTKVIDGKRIAVSTEKSLGAIQIIITPQSEWRVSAPSRNIQQSPQQNTEAACNCSSNQYNCGDFRTPYDAQSCYKYCIGIGAGDIHELDRDKDGNACEWGK